MRRPPSIVAASVAFTVTQAGSTNVAIPNRSDGTRARHVLISWEDTPATPLQAYIQPGLSGGSASTTTSPVFDMRAEHIILDVYPLTHIHARLVQTGSVSMKVTPLENQ